MFNRFLRRHMNHGQVPACPGLPELACCTSAQTHCCDATPPVLVHLRYTALLPTDPAADSRFLPPSACPVAGRCTSTPRGEYRAAWHCLLKMCTGLQGVRLLVCMQRPPAPAVASLLCSLAATPACRAWPPARCTKDPPFRCVACCYCSLHPHRLCRINGRAHRAASLRVGCGSKCPACSPHRPVQAVSHQGRPHRAGARRGATHQPQGAGAGYLFGQAVQACLLQACGPVLAQHIRCRNARCIEHATPAWPALHAAQEYWPPGWGPDSEDVADGAEAPGAAAMAASGSTAAANGGAAGGGSAAAAAAGAAAASVGGAAAAAAAGGAGAAQNSGGSRRRVRTQRDIFELLELPWREPYQRDVP